MGQHKGEMRLALYYRPWLWQHTRCLQLYSIRTGLPLRLISWNLCQNM